MTQITGLFPPLPNSFDSDAHLYPQKIAENIERLLAYNLAGILILGSNGELVMLSEADKEIVYKTAREAFVGNNMNLAHELQRKAVKPNTAVTSRRGIPALKAALDYIGAYGGPVREPLLSLDKQYLPELKSIIDTVK